jgi:ribosomal protein L25 (general stress protein Ctc)
MCVPAAGFRNVNKAALRLPRKRGSSSINVYGSNGGLVLVDLARLFGLGDEY